MKKEKIALNVDEKKNTLRDLSNWKTKNKRSKLNINFQEKMIDSRFPIEKMEDELRSKEFNKKAIEMDIETLKQEIKEEVQMDEHRSKLFAEKSNMELADKNIKVLEKQLRDGHFVDINTGDFVYREEQ